MFPTRTALVKHLISAEHRCLTVLCPWCRKKKRTFTRISDLEIHVSKSHKDVNLPKDRFSRANGFYYAIYPNDYAKIAESVQAYESDAAYDVRKAIRDWAEEFEDRKDRIESWNTGWKEGLKLAEMKNGRTNDRSDSKEERNSVRRDRPSKERREVTSSEGKRERSLEKRGEMCSKRREDKDIDAARVIEIGLGLVGHERAKKRKEVDCREDRTAKQSRISSERVDGLDTYRDDIELESGEIDEEVEISNKAKGRGKSTEREDLTTVHEQEKGSGTRERDRKDKDSEEMEGEMIEETLGSTDKREQVGSKGMEEAVALDREKSNGGEYRDVEEELEDPKRTEEPEPVTREEAIIEGTITDLMSETSSSSSSASSSSSHTTVNKPNLEADSLRARALDILRKGAMPICPPAKREWNTVIRLDCSSTNTHMVWPPSNWKSLSADQKLMAREYIALVFENRSKMLEFPAVSRRTLLDKYAFFALDGEKRPQEEENEADKVEAKIRQYNLSYLAKVAKGEICDSRTAWSIIKSTEKADRWTDTDHITKTLDIGNLKLKV